MVNEPLINLSRAIVTAVRGTEFDAEELKLLLLRVVPELLAEIEILSNFTNAMLPDLPDMEQEDSEDEQPASRNARRRKKRREAKK